MTDSVLQVLHWFLLTGLVVLALELLLYWLFYRFRSPVFWPVLLVTAIASGGLITYLNWPVTSEVEAQTPALWSLLWQTMGVPIGAALGLGVFFQFFVRGRHRVPFMMLAPAFLAVSLIVIYPFFFEFRLAFGSLNLYSIGRWLNGGDIGWASYENFLRVFTTSPLQTATFWQLLGRTCIWTAINLFFHVGFGLGLALLLNRTLGGRPLRGRAIYRTLLILPWAMPQVVAVLAWRGEFHPQFGFVNQLLSLFGWGDINWWSDPIPVFLSCCIVNVWLGIPFMMIVFLGGLQSISKSYYEAACIDGASSWTQFVQITLPMLKPTVVPAITLGTIWTFNNINVIYLMTGQDGGNEHADILVSALYKSAFTYQRYSYSAAFALVIFALLLLLTLVWMRVSRDKEAAAE